MSFLTTDEHRDLLARALDASRMKALNPSFVAIDFDSMIIHAPEYTWDEWCNTGHRNYPTSQPVRAEFVDSHPLHFQDFIDMRVYTSIYAK